MNKIRSDAVARATLKPLQPFLSDKDVFEVRINRYGEVVCDTVKGRKFHAVSSVTPEYVKQLTNALLHYNGKTLRSVNNVELPDGERGIICLPPAVAEGTVAICLRKHVVHGLTLADWRREGHFDRLEYAETVHTQAKITPFESRMLALYEEGPAQFEQFLQAAVEGELTICISGMTGSGKTTFTETLLDYVPETQRVIILEDVHEVQAARQKEVVYMAYSTQAGEGRRTAEECITDCMRLSPQRILLTELRDEAALSFIEGANTGHTGAIFSTHANGVESAPARIASLIKKFKPELEYSFIMRSVHAAVDVYLHMAQRDVVEAAFNPFKKHEALA